MCLLLVSVTCGELREKAVHFECASCFIWYRPAREEWTLSFVMTSNDRVPPLLGQYGGWSALSSKCAVRQDVPQELAVFFQLRHRGTQGRDDLILCSQLKQQNNKKGKYMRDEVPDDMTQAGLPCLVSQLLGGACIPDQFLAVLFDGGGEGEGERVGGVSLSIIPQLQTALQQQQKPSKRRLLPKSLFCKMRVLTCPPSLPGEAVYSPRCCRHFYSTHLPTLLRRPVSQGIAKTAL